MVCGKCGARNAGGERFCARCGAHLSVRFPWVGVLVALVLLGAGAAIVWSVKTRATQTTPTRDGAVSRTPEVARSSQAGGVASRAPTGPDLRVTMPEGPAAAAHARSPESAEAPAPSSTSRRNLRVLVGRPEVRGSLSKDVLSRIIRRHLAEVQYCLGSGVPELPPEGGRVAVQFTIAATGQVVASAVQESTLQSSSVEGCLAQAVRRWLFPRPPGGGIVIVSAPFVVNASR